jgi:HPt (histidine-containing phosphotransfer) domain-containing protein
VDTEKQGIGYRVQREYESTEDNEKKNIEGRRKMNFNEMAENIGLDEQDFREMAELFVSVGVTDLEKLRDAWESRNCQGVVMSAHSLKGASANLGFTDIYEIAKRVEADARAQKLDGANEAIGEIAQKLTSISAALEGH